MIIHNQLTKTLKASPLNSRGYAVPPDKWMPTTSTLKGSPVLWGDSLIRKDGRPLQGRHHRVPDYPQVVPTYGY